MKTKLIQIFLVITIFLFQGFSIYFTETFVIKPIVGEHFLPVTNIPFPYLFNTFLLFFFYSILFFLSQKVFFSFLLSLNLFILLALIHAFKLKYLGSVLFLTDFYAAGLKTVFAVFPGLGWKFFLLLFLTVFSISIFLYLYILLYQKEKNSILSWAYRINLFLVPFSLILFYLNPEASFENFYRDVFRLKPNYMNTQIHYQTQGLLLSLLDNYKVLYRQTKPETYPQALESELDSYKSKPGKKVSLNVILILAETFWDPLQYPSLQISPDPIPFFRSLAQKNGGKIIVPGFGGGTVLTEFEVLTGLSTQLVWGYPYVSAVHREVPSLASVYTSAKYKTSFLHSYHGWFYDRSRVVPLLGFNEFQYDKHFFREFQDEVIEDERYIIDEYFIKKLNREIKKKSPFFIFASNYATHGPYNKTAIRKHYKIGNTTLSSLHKEHLQANLNLLHNFDNNLEKLLEDLKTLKEPVLLVVFGDHVPNENYLGFSLRDYSDKDIDNFTCPYFAWSNVEIAKFPEKLSSNYLGLYLLKNSFPKDLPVFYRILEKVETTLPVFSFYKSTTEGKLYKNLPENYEKVIELYKLIQYDLLYGEKLSFP